MEISLGKNGASASAPSAFHKTSFAVDIKTGKLMGSVSAVTKLLIVGNCFDVLSFEEDLENEYPALLEGDPELVENLGSEDDSVVI